MILAQGPRSGDPLTIRRDARGRNARGDGGTDAPAEAMDGGTDAPAEAIRRTFPRTGALGGTGATHNTHKDSKTNAYDANAYNAPSLTMHMPTTHLAYDAPSLAHT